MRRLVAVADALEEHEAKKVPALTPSLRFHAPSLAKRPQWGWRTILGRGAIAYFSWNAFAISNSYRVAAAEASTLLTDDCQTVEVVLHMRSCSATAEVSRRSCASEEDGEALQEQPSVKRHVLPQLYLSDPLGRSGWMLTCCKTKRGTSVHTTFSSRSDNGAPGDDAGDSRQGAASV